MKEHDKFTELLLQDNKQKEKMWNDRFTLEKIPQYDAFKDSNYLSLSLLKTKNKIDEKNKNNKNNKNANAKKRIYSSHYTINSLTNNTPIQTPIQAKNNNENNGETKNNNINKKNLDKKRPHSIYLNRNKLSFMSGSNNSNSKINVNVNSNTNAKQQKQKIFYNYFSNKLKTQNEIS